MHFLQKLFLKTLHWFYIDYTLRIHCFYIVLIWGFTIRFFTSKLVKCIHWIYIDYTLNIHWFYMFFSDLGVLKFVNNIAKSFYIEFTLNIHWWYIDYTLFFFMRFYFICKKKIHWFYIEDTLSYIENTLKIGRWNRISMYFQCRPMYIQCKLNVVFFSKYIDNTLIFYIDFTLNLHCIYIGNTLNLHWNYFLPLTFQCIFNVKSMYVFKTMYFQCILNVFSMYSRCIFNVF